MTAEIDIFYTSRTDTSKLLEKGTKIKRYQIEEPCEIWVNYRLAYKTGENL